MLTISGANDEITCKERVPTVCGCKKVQIGTQAFKVYGIKEDLIWFKMVRHMSHKIEN